MQYQTLFAEEKIKKAAAGSADGMNPSADSTAAKRERVPYRRFSAWNGTRSIMIRDNTQSHLSRFQRSDYDCLCSPSRYAARDGEEYHKVQVNVSYRMSMVATCARVASVSGLRTLSSMPWMMPLAIAQRRELFAQSEIFPESA